MTERTYGAAPEIVAYFDLSKTWDEYTHRMYLPVHIPELLERPRYEGIDYPPDHLRIELPSDVTFARPLIEKAITHEYDEHGYWWTHVYLTVRMGYATPGNPLNRPGWHADGFGTDDINYVWTDRFPTEFAVTPFEGISDDDQDSLDQFDDQIGASDIVTHTPGLLMRLDASVIHRAPEIPHPGGERRFLKVSFSTERYNLKGNARNRSLTYDWPMHDRQAARNLTNGDSIKAD
jgi:hypothetical protein